jgi:class 3 adenylate cyclase
MSGPMREERKVVTALFADVVGSTELTERLDPEDAREVLGAAVRRMVEAVEAFGGTVKDLAGDGILALFGAPVTHEDDAERAIRAGLRTVSECGAAETPVNVRVGIETGLVVLGPVGGGRRVEYGATGDAINVAARLQSRAEPGSVLVGDATRRAAADRFAWDDELRLGVKGKAEPVSAFRILGDAEPSHRPSGSTPMVGREEEIERASRLAERALAGEGGVLVAVGEPGIGKSRLVDELRRHVAEVWWLEGRCVSYGSSTPYLPMRAVVVDALERTGGELDDLSLPWRRCSGSTRTTVRDPCRRRPGDSGRSRQSEGSSSRARGMHPSSSPSRIFTGPTRRRPRRSSGSCRPARAFRSCSSSRRARAMWRRGCRTSRR